MYQFILVSKLLEEGFCMLFDLRLSALKKSGHLQKLSQFITSNCCKTGANGV